MTRELAEAVAYTIIHPDAKYSDVAHDWKVSAADIKRVMEEIDDDGADLEERIADAIQELWD